MKRLVISVILVIALLVLPVSVVLAATTADVTVTATPSYISIANSPDTYDFGAITENTTANTTNGYFAVSNNSSVNIDLSIGSNGWSGTTPWTYGAAAPDTGQLKASSADGGVGGSAGAGAFDRLLPAPTGSILLCDNVTALGDVTWELQLETPTSFSHGYEQTTIVTLTASAE